MSQTSNKAKRWRSGAGALAAVGVLAAGAALSAAAVGAPSLGAARSFGVLGGSTVASTGLTNVTGNVGVSPGSAVTGFPPGIVTNGSIHAGDATAAEAHADAALAYTFLAGMASIPANNLTGTDLGGLTLPPAVYKFNTSAQLTGTLTLDAQGDSEALFVFQIGSTLTTASNASVIVINGGADFDESGIFWQVGSSATLGSGTAFTGNILASASITVVTGSSLVGNALAIDGGVTLDSNAVVTTPAVVGPPDLIPATPLSLTVVAIAGTPSPGAQLEWTDASDDETEFRVFRREGSGPDFLRVGTVISTTKLNTGSRLGFQDRLLAPATTYSYRVIAFSSQNGASLPSNEVLFDSPAIIPTPGRWLDVELGYARSFIEDRKRSRSDRILLRGSYTVIDVATGTPVVVHATDPRPLGVTLQIKAPGTLVLVTIPANEPSWKVLRTGVYRWTARGSRTTPTTTVTIDTLRSEFILKSSRNEFGFEPVNSITVSLTTMGATASDVRAWTQAAKKPRGTRTLFNLKN